MDASLEEELLQIAGRPASKKRARPAPSDSPGGSSRDDEPGTQPAGSDHRQARGKQPRKAAAAMPFKKRAGAAKDQEEAEDDDHLDEYGSDLIGDEEDRARLAALNELQREMILAERSEARDRKRERRELLRQRQREAAADQAGAMRSSTRAKQDDTAKRSAMAELVAAKAARTQRTRERQAQREEDEDAGWSEEDAPELSESEEAMSDAPASSAMSGEEPAGADEDRSEEGGPDWGRADDADDHQGEEAEEAGLEEALKVQMRRVVLAKWLGEPFFARTVPGCFVRVSVRGRYLVARILEARELPPGSYPIPGGGSTRSPYTLEGGQRTSMFLVLQRGESKRDWPLTLVSNHRYTYTSEDVAAMLEAKRAAGRAPRNAAAERAWLSRCLDAAVEGGNADLEARLREQLADLETRAGAERGGERRGGGMAHINRRNATANFDNAFRNVGARPGGAPGSASATAAAAAGDDPFSRRKTRPMNYWNTKRIAGEAAGDGAALAIVVPPPGGGAARGGEPDTPVTATTGAAAAVENAAGEVDLDLDLSVLGRRSRATALAAKLLAAHWQRALSVHAVPRDLAAARTLTLADYKRRQGIA